MPRKRVACRCEVTTHAHLAPRVAVHVPAAHRLVVAARIQLVERIPSHRGDQLLVRMARLQLLNLEFHFSTRGQS